MRTFVILLLFLLWAAAEGRRRKLPHWHIKMAQEQGPNTCAVEELPAKNATNARRFGKLPEPEKQYWTECKYWMPRRICGRKTIIRYECCEGYQTIPGEHGCTGVKPLKDLLETAEDLGATIFVQYIKEAGLENQFRQASTATLFAPTNLAFESVNRQQRDMLAKSFRNPQSPILLYHLVNRRVHSKDFHSDLLVDTILPGHKISLNKYSSGMMTANCAPVMRKDQEAINGIVHLVEQVLAPQTPRNVFDSIAEDGRFNELTQMLKDTGVSSQLANGNNYFTIFAPSDEEFTNVPRAKREQIKKDLVGQTVLSQNHIVPHTICLPAIVDEHKMTTLNGNKLSLICNETGLYVQGNRITEEQIIGSNGVIHLIGSIISHDRAKSIWDLTTDYNLELFSHLARRTGLEAQLENYGDVTVFAFTDGAFRDLDQEEQDKLIQNMDAARDLLRFHIAPGRYLKNTIYDDQKITTLDRRNMLRMRIYRKGCGVESAMMVKTDIEGLNGVIHIIDRVLKPPSNDILNLLQQDGNFTIISEAVQKVRKVDPTILDGTNHNSGTMTFFAPSDEAFWKLGEDKLREVMGNTSYLTKVVKNHIVDNMYSSGSFRSQLHYNVQTQESTVEIHKSSHNIKIGQASVMTPDIITKEGIVHTLDSVLIPDEANNLRHHNHRHTVVAESTILT